MYAKVFSQIFDSSIAEDYQVRFVFEDLLKLANSDGVVDMTREAIARRTNVPLEIVCRGISALEAPDPNSRTPDHDGSRIKRLDDHRDWGWWIVNYEKFREIANEEKRREKTRIRVARFKQKQAEKEAGNALVTLGNAPVTTTNDGNAIQREREKHKEKHTHTERCASVFDELRKKLCGLYERPETQPMSYKDESCLAEVARRPDVLAEFGLIEDYFSRTPAESKRYLPRSLGKLLEGWDDILDAARTLSSVPLNGEPVKETLIDKQLKAIQRL